MSDYKFQIQETIKALNEIESMLYTQMLNIAMEGELKEVNDSLEIGEVVNFKYGNKID